MNCEHCGYYWQEENEEYPYCHYYGSYPPCEQEDDYESEE